MPLKILILAGTMEARLLANRLINIGHEVISSFAGVTENPLLPEGQIRVGGFGGVDGLRRYLAEERIDVVVDAAHPFAAVISAHAAEAWPDVLRLERPAWFALPKDQWLHVSDVAGAVSALPMDARVMLTIGRKEVAAFALRAGVARMIEPPAEALRANWQLLFERPPFTLESEVALMKQHKITHLVTKNAGGRETAAKLEAARILGLPTVMIARPFKPIVQTYATVDAIAAAIASR